MHLPTRTANYAGTVQPHHWSRGRSLQPQDDPVLLPSCLEFRHHVPGPVQQLHPVAAHADSQRRRTIREHAHYALANRRLCPRRTPCAGKRPPAPNMSFYCACGLSTLESVYIVRSGRHTHQAVGTWVCCLPGGRRCYIANKGLAMRPNLTGLTFVGFQPER